ncbi:MAG: hypothetical protein OHM77_05340 [Candidatus Nitricoxidivorans perseverans]|uniref:Uncharacterized protein n=1 Tax=Candidatus Nitricoxidivorans perseverans TaxID=2975601 RepID=A0AA49J1S9_9PROT|nr:MAG: hypothetical protein OHM77_05340 [Candidatus Nitricoxidivorans perseverans]
MFIGAAALADAPTPGTVIYVSAITCDDDGDCDTGWVLLAFASLEQTGAIHAIEALEAIDLTFTGNFINEATRWLTCRVVEVRTEKNSLVIEANIESATWNKEIGNDELERKLTDPDWEIRWSTVRNPNNPLTPRQIDRAQQDRKRMVRCALAMRFDLTLDAMQIEVGLTDADADVRRIYAYRKGYVLTPVQIERGLNDPCETIRLDVANRPEAQID